MLIDPQALVEYRWPVLWVTLLTLLGKLFSTTIGALLSGQPLRQSLQVGMSMAQIGEFAFIVATLGLSLGVISEFLFPVAVGASAITTFTTPYMIRYSDTLYNTLEKILPKRWVRFLNRYSTSTDKLQAEGNWRIVLRSIGLIVLINGIILLAIYALSINFLAPFLYDIIDEPLAGQIISASACLLLALPFLWAIMSSKPATFAYKQLWLNNRYNRGPLLVLEISRVVLGILIISFFVDRLISANVAIIVAVVAVPTVLYLFSKKLKNFYQKLESRFLSNLKARENEVIEADPIGAGILLKNATLQTELTPWAAYIADMEIGQHASYAGFSLDELSWREQYGISIAYIKRGDRLIHSPGGKEKLLPYDHVGIISTEEQMKNFKKVFEATVPIAGEQPSLDDIVLQKIAIDEFTLLRGLSIRESKIREQTSGLIVGIERDNHRILNPDSSLKFQWGDTVWLVGERKKIQELRKGEP